MIDSAYALRSEVPISLGLPLARGFSFHPLRPRHAGNSVNLSCATARIHRRSRRLAVTERSQDGIEHQVQFLAHVFDREAQHQVVSRFPIGTLA